MHQTDLTEIVRQCTAKVLNLQAKSKKYDLQKIWIKFSNLGNDSKSTHNTNNQIDNSLLRMIVFGRSSYCLYS